MIIEFEIMKNMDGAEDNDSGRIREILAKVRDLKAHKTFWRAFEWIMRPSSQKSG